MRSLSFPKVQVTSKTALISLCIIAVAVSYASIRLSPDKTFNNLLILGFSILLVFCLSRGNLRKLSHFNPGFLLFLAYTAIISLSFNPRFYVGAMPYIGLVFSRQRYFATHTSALFLRIAIFTAGCLSSLIFYLQITVFKADYGFVSSVNGNSVVIIFLMLVELTLFRKVSFVHLPAIIFSILFLKNRSAMFFLFAMPWPLVPEIVMVSMTILALALSLGLLTIETLNSYDILVARAESGNSLLANIRGTFIVHFLEEFEPGVLISHDNSYLLSTYPYLPVGGSGYINPHNSFIELILRDKFFGLLSIFIWFSCLPVMPARIWISITCRAFYDSFFISGPMDIILFYYIGTHSQLVTTQRARSEVKTTSKLTIKQASLSIAQEN